METKVVPFIEVKALETKGEFVGYGSTFGNVDHGGDMVVEGAFKRSLKQHVAEGTMPAMLFNHDMSEPIGHWTDIAEDSKGLRLKGQLWVGQGISKAEQAYQMLSHAGMKGLSIGYATKSSEPDAKARCRKLTDLDIFEISPVAMPMNPRALISTIKSLKSIDGIGTIRDFEKLLRDVGLTQSEAKAFCAEGYKGLNRRDDGPDLEEIAQALRANITRINTK